jgi:hypothetical protein
VTGASRNKGKVGERELAGLLSELTGWPVTRRVRQHAGDHDLEGLTGWSIEVKRHAKVTPGLIATWWDQAHRQAVASYSKAVLFYRADRGQWRAVWAPIGGSEYQDTTEADLSLWWRMAGR